MLNPHKAEACLLLESCAFEPGRTLGNGHTQTLFQSLMGRAESPALELRQVPTPDGDRLDVYIEEGPATQAPAPMVLIAHGLEGSHRSPYMRGLQCFLKRRGWASASLVHRSCGGRMNATKRMYHSGETDDLTTTSQWLAKRYPARPLFAVGYSLSANQVGKWLGTRDAEIPKSMIAAAAVSPPFDLSVTSSCIDTSLGGVYRHYFLRSLVPKSLAKAKQFPGLLDERRIRAVSSLRSFDDVVTSQLHGFDGAEDYYKRVAWLQFLSGVKRPLMVVAAENDPFSPGSTIPRGLGSEHPWLHPVISRSGGHVGFIEGRVSEPRFWAESQLLRFFQYYLTKAEVGAMPRR